MDLLAIATPALWAALYASGLAVLLTAPARYLVPTFVCGFIGRGARDVCLAWGMGFGWATVSAAVVVVLVAAAIIRRDAASPVVLICSVIPLGAAVAMFNLIFALMRVATVKDQDASAAAATLASSLGSVFITSLGIALGLAAGLAIVRLVRRVSGRNATVAA